MVARILHITMSGKLLVCSWNSPLNVLGKGSSHSSAAVHAISDVTLRQMHNLSLPETAIALWTIFYTLHKQTFTKLNMVAMATIRLPSRQGS